MVELKARNSGFNFLPISHDANERSRNMSSSGFAGSKLSGLPSISEQKEVTIKSIKFDRVGLYGRDEERSQLKQCIGRLTSGETSTEISFIDGNSGTGKTSLALSMREDVDRVGGVLVMGNYDFALREEPYSAIGSACNELCSEAANRLGKSDFEALQREMFHSFDALDLTLLREIIPATQEIAPQLDDMEEVHMENVRSEDKKARLPVAFQKFIRIMSSVLNPLVIFLDDLQWADVNSLDLLRSTFHLNNKNLMLIGSYRTNEVFSHHPLSKLVDELRDLSEEDELINMNEIPLSGLPLEDIREYLRDLLSPTNELDVMGLARVCFTRSRGNPFFVKTFLSMLAEVNLMDCNDDDEWSWDIASIERAALSTRNVSDFIKGRIKRSCKGDIGDLLLFSACLGNVFEKKYLAMVWEAFNKTIALEHVLDESVERLFIEPVGDSRYRYVHSAVKEAAISMISKPDFDRLKHSVGTILLQNMEQDFPVRMTFVLANLVNHSQQQDPHVAQLNLRAATRAKELAAFSSAAAYASEGIKRLPSSMWEEYTELTVSLHSVGAEAERCVGNIIQAKIYCNTVLQQSSVSLFDTMRVHNVMIDMLEQGNQMKAALEYCLEALDSVGCSFPRGSMGQSLRALAALKQSKTPRYIPDITSLDNLDLMRNPEKRYGMELLEAASSSAYFSGNKVMVFLLCSRRIKWTVDYGLHVSSPSAFAVLAGIFMHAFGDWERGKALANLSLSALKKLQEMGEKPSEPKTLCRVNFFVSTWTQPPRAMEKPLYDTYKSGMRHGDIDSASKTLVWLVHCELFSGKSLKSVELACRPRIAEIEDLKYEKWAKVLRLAWQSVLNLMGHSANTIVLTGTASNEGALLKESADSFAKLHLVQFYKRYLCAFFGEYQEGAESSIQYGETFMKTFPGAYLGFDPFHRAICLYAATRIGKQSRFRKSADRIRSMIKSWVEKKAPNHVHQLSILNAEHAAGGGKPKAEVCRLFEKAIDESVSGGFVQNAALAEERFSDYLIEMDEELEAQNHLTKAIGLYRKWGAMRKVELLTDKFGDFLARVPKSFKAKGTGRSQIYC